MCNSHKLRVRDYVLGYTVFTGTLRYGRIEFSSVSVRRNDELVHAVLMKPDENKTEGLAMSMRHCIFSSRSVLR